MKADDLNARDRIVAMAAEIFTKTMAQHGLVDGQMIVELNADLVARFADDCFDAARIFEAKAAKFEVVP